MLPRIQRSIFHLGEEGGHGHRGATTDHHGHGENVTNTHHQHFGGQSYGHRRLFRRERDAADAVVGLQILVQHQYRHPQAHIVLKPMVSWPPARYHRNPCSFSRACYFLCRRELSPTKDVYMYRGDQGFCSEECRWQQILADEGRENEAMAWKDRRGLPHSRRHHQGPRPSTAAVRRAQRRLLAVA